MKIEIQYLRHFEYGVRQSLPLHVNPEFLVSELKTVINSHIKTPANHQELYVHLYGKFELMMDETSLSFYQIQEGQIIMLKNPHYREQLEKDQVNQERDNKKKQEQMNYQQRSKKLFDKLGLFKDPLLQQQIQSQQQNAGSSMIAVGDTKSTSSLIDGKVQERGGSMILNNDTGAKDSYASGTFGGGAKSDNEPKEEKPEEQQESLLVNQDQVGNTKKMHDLLVIDEICNLIRINCQEQDIVRLMSQYQIEEAKVINMQISSQNKKQNENLDQINSSSTPQVKPTMPQDVVLDLNTVGTEQFSPLHVACSIGNESIVHYLVNKKLVDPNVMGRQEWIPLEIACWNGHPRIVDMLLKDKRTKLNYSHSIRGSCLHLAAKGDHFQICQMLLMYNIDLTLTNESKQRAKDVTDSKKILNIIAWYEANKDQINKEGKVQQDLINVIEEDDEEEEHALSSQYTQSPVDTNSILNPNSIKMMPANLPHNLSYVSTGQSPPFAQSFQGLAATPNSMIGKDKPLSKIQRHLQKHRTTSNDDADDTQNKNAKLLKREANDRESQSNSFSLVAEQLGQVIPVEKSGIVPHFGDQENKEEEKVPHQIVPQNSEVQNVKTEKEPVLIEKTQAKEEVKQQDLSLEYLMSIDINDQDKVEFVIKEMKSHRDQKKPYKSFFPIKRLKGTVKKVHRMGMSTYSRFLYVNPIEGVLISYQSQSKFPHSPSYIIKLNEIKECGVLFDEKQAKWFFKKGMYYFIVRSEAKTAYFFHDNLDLVNYWIREIHDAKEFYEWFQKLTAFRYDPEVQQNNPSSIPKIDFIIDNIIDVVIPECDLDQYTHTLQIDCSTFAQNFARSFCENQSQTMTGQNPNDGGDVSSKTDQTPSSATQDGQNLSQGQVSTPPNMQGGMTAAGALMGDQNSDPPKQKEINIQKSEIEDFQRDLNRMKEMQERQELPPDDIEEMKNAEPALLDDGLYGIGFKSFEILDILGHGAFGKVFKCTKIDGDDKTEYAMKVLKKAFLYKNKHLKYAITECNVLKQAKHPFVIKMHYSFQTPDNLYMILDYCSGCDLAYHLNKKQIFDEDESRFFIGEIILAIEYVHSLNVVYRDLKPENILIDKDGHCRLADFGLAKENIGEKDFAKSFCGSPAYLAPEMLNSKGVSKAADIYQIGAVLYEFLVGFPPYYTENIKELYNSIRSARLQIPRYISKEGKDLLNQLLNKRPDKRITIEKLKQHDFFKNLDWAKLMAKELKPPILLRGEDPAGEDENNEEYLFLKQQERKFKDRDYTETNQLQNRLKQFTFIRGQEQRPGPQPPMK